MAIRKGEVTTLAVGERAWFVRQTDSTLAWALYRPHDDGSASIRTDAGFLTFSGDEAVREALAHLTQEGYVWLDEASATGAIPAGAKPPKW